MDPIHLFPRMAAVSATLVLSLTAVEAQRPGAERAIGSPSAEPRISREVTPQLIPPAQDAHGLTPSQPGARTRQPGPDESLKPGAPAGALPGATRPSIAAAQQQDATPRQAGQQDTTQQQDAQQRGMTQPRTGHQQPVQRPSGIAPDAQQRQAEHVARHQQQLRLGAQSGSPLSGPPGTQGGQLSEGIAAPAEDAQSLVPRRDTITGATLGAESGSMGTSAAATGGSPPGGTGDSRLFEQSPGGLVTPGGAGTPLQGGGTIRPQAETQDTTGGATRQDFRGLSGNIWWGDRPEGRPGAVPQLAPEQRNVIRTAVARAQPTEVRNIEIDMRPGAIIPADAQLQDMPTQVVTGVPSYMTYKYVVAQGQILIVDPVELRIINIIPAVAG